MVDPAFEQLATAHPAIPWRSGWRDLRGLRLHVVEGGPPDGPPVLLLHGFPEFWWGWRRQLPALAAAGYRVVAPDLPGYNLSDKPKGLGPYGLDRLSDVVRGLIDRLEVTSLPVIGHDWGGVVAWWSALRFPERIARLAVLNAPHPAVFRHALRRDPEQRRRSRYIVYFQLPWLPERRLRQSDYRPFRSIFRRTSRPGTFDESELAAYAAAAARPGALTAMLNWYRAALWRPPRRPAHAQVEPPVRILWGAEDLALGRSLVEPSAARCRAAGIHWIESAGHWVQHEAAAEVNRSLLDFLA